MDCSICCETFNKSSVKKIQCIYCNESHCFSCLKSYLLGGIDIIPHCMNCKKEWQYDFFISMCTKTFVNKEWKNHKEKILLDREKARMQESMQDLAREKELKIIKKEMSDTNTLILDLKRKLWSLQDKAFLIKHTDKSSAPRKEFVKKCPDYNCRGFISTQWNCDLCEKKFCNKCHEENNENHICNKDIVANISLLKKDSKNCPKCQVLIHKIDGCSQMFCTQCHVAFDWRTGKIEKGIIHNPHFYQWQRDQNNGVAPRVTGDNPNFCGDVNDILGFAGIKNQKLARIHRFRGDLLHRLENFTPDADNSDLRLKYLLNEMTEEQLKKNVQQRHKRNMKKEKIREVLHTFITISNELLLKAYNDKNNYNGIASELNQLRIYVNKCFTRVLCQFDSKANIQIDDKWRNLYINI